jgi:hypothetical protein
MKYRGDIDRDISRPLAAVSAPALFTIPSF